MSGSITDYSSASSTMSDWIENIAPKYFNFDLTNNLRTGVFGYVNEVMSTSTEDTFNAVTIARREFYPPNALYTSSIYRMAALQELDAPMSNAATVKAMLVIKEADLIDQLTNNDDTYTIPDTTVFSVGDIPFTLDYPIIIESNTSWINNPHYFLTPAGQKKQDTRVYTVRYDRDQYDNSLNKTTTLYLQNKVVRMSGERVLLIAVQLRQVTFTEQTRQISKNAHIDIVTEDFEYDGNLANFEVFYKEAGSDIEYQLKKVIMNGTTPNEKFCMYMLVDDHTIRIHFPANNYFTPTFNSEIRIRIYTTLGSEGNFDEYTGRIVANTDGDSTFSGSSQLVIEGATNGSSSGGTNVDELEDFRREVQYAYTTNMTICTDHDLQECWDEKNQQTNNKVIFFKKRDDVFMRLYGAYNLLRDTASNVIPTNTLDLSLVQGKIITATGELDSNTHTDFSEYYSGSDRLVLKPGAIFRYADDGSENDDFKLAMNQDDVENYTIYSDFSMYEQICDYIHEAILYLYGDESVNADIELIKESSYSYILTGISESDFVKSIEDYITDRYGTIHAIYDIHGFMKIIAPNEFETYADAAVYATSDKNAYVDEIVTVVTTETDDEGNETKSYKNYVIGEEKDLIEYGSYPMIIHVRISYFLFTCPYLISVLRKPNVVGYYLNTLQLVCPLDYQTVVRENKLQANISSGVDAYVQFIANNLRIERNAILGENFYKLSVTISPSTESTDFIEVSVVNTDTTDEANLIRAPFDGIVLYTRYENEDSNRFVLAPTAENESITLIKDPTAGIFTTIASNQDGTQYKIRTATQVYPGFTVFGTQEESQVTQTITGFTMQYSVSSYFTSGDVIAIKKDKDIGRIRCMLHVNADSNGWSEDFIPMALDSYDVENNYFTFAGYIATDDEITLNDTFHITRGLYTLGDTLPSGITRIKEKESKLAYVSTTNGIKFTLATFIGYDDANSPNNWDQHAFVMGDNTTHDLYDSEVSMERGTEYHQYNDEHENTGSGGRTFTNEYCLSEDCAEIQLIVPIRYIRSTSIIETETSEESRSEALEKAYKHIIALKKNAISQMTTKDVDGSIIPKTSDIQFALNEDKHTIDYWFGNIADALYSEGYFPRNNTREEYSINDLVLSLTAYYEMAVNTYVKYLIKSVPVVKANWIKNPDNAYSVATAISKNHAFCEDIYTTLENNFSIDMKFYNTYGRSRFYRAGIRNSNELEPLDRVNCSFKFGVYIDQTVNQTTFETRFCTYVKEYVESINDIEAEGRSLYILNLIAAVKDAFPEIKYIEYYGINDYDHSVQKIESSYESKVALLGYNEYVPEFINANGVNNDFTIEPDISLTFLEQ